MTALVCVDHNRHSCIAFPKPHAVEYIPLSIEGLSLEQTTSDEFFKLYKQLENYPPEKAAKLYTEFALEASGATIEVMQKLATLINVTEKEIQMATAKKSTIKEPVSKTKPATKKVATKSVEKPVAKKVAAAKPVAKEKPAKKSADGKPSCAERFRELIAEGKLDDDAIFAKVQKEYDLDGSKRRYVNFYRFDCKRKGLIK